MNSASFSGFIISSLALIPAGNLLAAKPAKTEKMNIVIILADDLGWGNVGFHGSNIRTPHLDQLAKEGIQLDRFYTAPVSSPTRAGLMTGRYPNRFGIRETVIPPWRDFGLDPEEETLAAMLGKAGYPNRAIIGKWHLGHSRKAYYPLSMGFTHFYGHLNGAIDYFTHEREGELDWHRDWETSYDKGYSTDLISDEAVKCINEYSGKDPFFLYVAYNAPHGPLQAKPEDIALYTDDIQKLSGQEKKQVTYAAMVTCMDRGIGEILKTIKEKGIENNTLVLFFSDNGAEPNGGGSNLPLRGSKFQEWDGGVRVPAVIRYPDKLKGKRQIDQVMGFVDVMPTIRAMLNIQGAPHRPFDGIDVARVLTGEVKTIDRDFYLGCGAMVNNDYKLVLPGKNPKIKITEPFLSYYPADPYEGKNVAGSYPQVVERMKKLTEQYDAVEPPFKVLPYDEGKDEFKAPFEWKVAND